MIVNVGDLEKLIALAREAEYCDHNSTIAKWQEAETELEDFKIKLELGLKSMQEELDNV